METSRISLLKAKKEDKPGPDAVKIEREEVDGDNAKVYYKLGDEGEKALNLKKEGGKWKVIFSKTGLMDDAMDGASDAMDGLGGGK